MQGPESGAEEGGQEQEGDQLALVWGHRGEALLGGSFMLIPASGDSCLPLPGLNRLLGQVLNSLSKGKLFSLHPRKCECVHSHI